MKVAIVGTGITGLSIAYQLEKKGISSVLFDTAKKVGGVLNSSQFDGFLCEKGAHTLEIKTPEVQHFINEMNLTADTFEIPSKSNRYIVHKGQLQALPLSFCSFLKTPLFSIKAKLKLLTEPFVSAYKGSDDESLGHFVTRRLGKEFLDYAIDPFVAGVYAGDPFKLSVKQAFPKLHELEAQYGSLIKGGFLAKRKNGPRFKKRIISFRRGMHMLPEAIEKKLNSPIHLKTTLEAIEQKGDAWELTWNGQKEIFSHLIITVPAHKVKSLPWPQEISNKLSVFDQIEYAPIATVNLGFRQQDISGKLDGFGFLVPRKEKMNILGTLYPSTMLPNRAGKGHVLLTTFIGGSRFPEAPIMPQKAMINLVLSDLKKLFTIKGTPIFSSVKTYQKAIPQYNLGYDKILKGMQTIEDNIPGLHFAGNYRTGIAVGQCIHSAIKFASQFKA
ncbi:MAG: protoporphyrinogen oxidase [Verrucomicrobia bacterium CG_4_10_14_3_um_filter_43_23]|nr:MAG: protoporphyrinogen oxidase [Verrucomicrobia bacterium CG1_02_43_26]PIP59783.1 MAG: protoporphyrinogen oxidase [Verrucomicrobia bacterium CG22_combo_CG10-13_8_21_14_all_43_17]PIX57790.1 MAG: protoporphyrinogen oxidase [Verrucomicrobia bacterium CG_4_10_14_3_um_filter_43_23]PIY60888.1 MAG: protoporphyrinogen oxidase [Verrucomicrobia bacterium CG_4_10_14_0_8_um_filter_43_34]PJA43507.1 MAG: protoporphyrinogen oxidase [Verrucomicrobia bacterium CG_4_9_14_3_um_filter_43_20]